MSQNTQTLEKTTQISDQNLELSQPPIGPVQPPVEYGPREPDITELLLASHSRRKEAASRKLAAKRDLIDRIIDEGVNDLNGHSGN